MKVTNSVAALELEVTIRGMCGKENSTSTSTFSRILTKRCLLNTSTIYTHIANLKVLPHQEVEGCAGVRSDGAYAAAAAPQQAQTQVSTLLGFLLEQQLGKLQRETYPK